MNMTAKTFGEDYGILYGLKNRNNGKLVIGSKVSGDYASYVTSLQPDNEFWDDYRKGEVDRFVLATPSVEMTKAAEWMALDFGLSQFPNNFYNIKNSAHKVDERVNPEIMKNIINFITGEEFIDHTPKISDISERAKKLAEEIESNCYPVVKVPTDVVLTYDRKQVRSDMTNEDTARKIAQFMRAHPQEAQQKINPITAVVMPDKKICINNGNTTLTAADWAHWSVVPVVYVQWTDLCDDVKTLPDAQELLGSHLNKDDGFYKKTNSQNDLKAQFARIVENNMPDFDPNVTPVAGVSYIKNLLEDYFLRGGIIPTPQQFEGAWKSFYSDATKKSHERMITGKFRNWTESELKRKRWVDYEQHGIPCIYATADKLKLCQAATFALRHLKQKEGVSGVKEKKGAIIIHYKNKSQVVDVEQNNLVQENSDFLKWLGYDISIEVLPYTR